MNKKSQLLLFLRFLDVLIVLLSKPKLCTLLPILLSIKDELVEPLLKHEGVEVQWRVLKCLSLFALLDRNFAAENVKLLCAPVCTRILLLFLIYVVFENFQISYFNILFLSRS